MVGGLPQSSLCASRWSASWRELGAELSPLLPSSPLTWKSPNIFHLWRWAVCEEKTSLRLDGACKRSAVKTCEKHPSKGKLIPALCWRDEAGKHPSKGSSGESKMQEAESAVRAGSQLLKHKLFWGCCEIWGCLPS